MYATVVGYYSEDLLAAVDPAVEQLTAANYWDTIADLYRQQFQTHYEKPWVLGVVKSTRSLSEEARVHERLGQLFRQAQRTVAELLSFLMRK